MTDEFFPDGREDWMEGYTAARKLDGDEWLVVRPMIFSQRLAVMTADNASVEHWCYESIGAVFVAWAIYPTIMPNWKRHQRRDRTMEHPVP